MVMDFLQRRPSSFPRPRIGGGARTAISIVKQRRFKRCKQTLRSFYSIILLYPYKKYEKKYLAVVQ